MSDRIRQMTPDLLAHIEQLWQESAARLADEDRSPTTLRFHLFEDSSAAWYRGPGRTIFMLRGIMPYHGAYLTVLNSDGRAPFIDHTAVRAVLRGAMEDFRLHRLVAIIPAPLVRVLSLALEHGFQREGRMREVMFYNGTRCDGELLSLLWTDIAGEPGKRKRRRRRRRKENFVAQENKAPVAN